MNSLIKYSFYLSCMLIAFTDTLAAKVDPSRLTHIPEQLTASTIATMRRCKTASIVNLMDRDVEPCNNFYKFACGKWTRLNPATTIEHLTTGLFEELSQLLDRKVEKLLTNDTEFNYTAIDNKVQNFFVSCVNLVKLKDKYKQKLSDIIAEFGEMPALSGAKWNAEKFDWVTTIAKIAHKYGKDIIIGMDIMADFKDNSINRVYIGQADLPLESRAMYLDDSTAVYRDSYKRKIRKELVKFLGMDAQLATKTANDIVDFEVKLAQGLIDDTLGQSLDDLSKLTTVELMQAKYAPVIDIKKLVNITLGELITDPLYEYADVYQRNLKKIMPETPKEVVANYIFYTLISDYMLDIDKSPRSQRKTCIEKTKSYFAKNVDNMVYRRYSTRKTELDVEYMWKELKESFKSTLTSGKLDWIAEPTRQYALEKLEALRMEINSYADHNFTEEFGPLVTNNNDYLANVLAILELDTKRSYAKLHEKPKPIEAGEILSYTPANILIENVIKVPVSILQPYLLWSEIYPTAVKFGTLGALVGHELIHAFDDTGRRFDKDGNSRDWWDAKSTEIFLNRTECFSNQYSKYQYGGRFLPKSVSQSENIADNGGMRLAYQAYLRWYEDAKRAHNEKMNEKLPDFPYDFKQLFFISFAQIWCNDAHPEVKNLQTSTDQHVPGEFRVIGPLSNSKEFAAAFSCADDAPMNPKHKCQIY
ncbi:membrane metallo-endopeptidase-like 1 [Rhagoletis pomonella]|uniref:membrane metallo-endopeptidase-like 1 n=1 Tax=Rhagoletis pomonella TaxID=28610 RepID=UPI00177E97D6|nr:membrane metallo-endopeptidase-like 1 [Rhagoletis pomonella]